MKKLITAATFVVCIVLFAWITSGPNLAQHTITEKEAIELREKSESHYSSPRLTDAVSEAREITISEDFVFAKGKNVYYYFFHDGEWENLRMEFTSEENRFRFLDEMFHREDPFFAVTDDEIVVRYISN